MERTFLQKCAAVMKQEAVSCIALACALISMVFVPPNADYVSYIDFRVLALLVCLMAVVAGLQDCGVFAVLAQKLLSGRRRMRFISLVLVLLPFFTSMLITNDVALITFVPFTLLVLGLVGRMERAVYLVALQTVAANLGSMATPVGNPQNLYLYSAFQIPAGDFFAATLPLTLVSLIGLAAAALCVRPEGLEVRFPERQRLRKPRQLGMMGLLFALCLLSVFHALHYAVLLAVILFCLILFARRLLARVDYGLLITFVCFFIFAGNIGNIPAVKALLSDLMAANGFLTALGASQLISNVPAAVLLSGFTADWRGLLLGTDVGGLGTLIASLASLISFRLYLRSEGAKPLRYLGVFTLVNIVGLAVLIGVSFLFIL